MNFTLKQILVDNFSSCNENMPTCFQNSGFTSATLDGGQAHSLLFQCCVGLCCFLTMSYIVL